MRERTKASFAFSPKGSSWLRNHHGRSPTGAAALRSSDCYWRQWEPSWGNFLGWDHELCAERSRRQRSQAQPP